MFKSPNTQPLWQRVHHRCQFDGSSKTMFESSKTHPHKLLERHRRMQERRSTNIFLTVLTSIDQILTLNAKPTNPDQTDN